MGLGKNIPFPSVVWEVKFGTAASPKPGESRWFPNTYRTGLLFVPLQTPASKAGWIPPMTHPRFENPRGTAPERERTFVFVCRGVTDREEGTRPQGANRLSPPTTASPASGGLLKRPTAILVGGRHVDAGLPESVKLPSPSVHPVALQPSVYSRPIGLSEPRKPTSDDISIFYLKILYENHPVQARRACTFRHPCRQMHAHAIIMIRDSHAPQLESNQPAFSFKLPQGPIEANQPLHIVLFFCRANGTRSQQ
jgi:hypothetical protein